MLVDRYFAMILWFYVHLGHEKEKKHSCQNKIQFRKCCVKLQETVDKNDSLMFLLVLHELPACNIIKGSVPLSFSTLTDISGNYKWSTPDEPHKNLSRGGEDLLGPHTNIQFLLGKSLFFSKKTMSVQMFRLISQDRNGCSR